MRDLDDPVEMTLTVEGDRLQLVVSGEDRGGLSRDDIRDRVESAGGSVAITIDGGLSRVEVRLPTTPGRADPGRTPLW